MGLGRFELARAPVTTCIMLIKTKTTNEGTILVLFSTTIPQVQRMHVPWKSALLKLLRGFTTHFRNVGGAQVRCTRPEACRDIVGDGGDGRIRIRGAEPRHFRDSCRT